MSVVNKFKSHPDQWPANFIKCSHPEESVEKKINPKEHLAFAVCLKAQKY